ncbi:MAG: endonuclease/exonuclease/phosphatase family protein [Phycisphaeraceae bacterium]|nr:MAG: endonuclease/exonuclease/phosphatase family protein [Phycisphaeraceae bacterium]
MLNTFRRASWAVLALPFLTACATGPTGSAGRVAIDGDLREWGHGVVTSADGDSLYFRFSPGEEMTLQATNETTRLVFDLDNDPSTGKQLVGPPDVGTLGVDLEVLFSPPLSEIDPEVARRVIDRRIQRGQPASAFTGGMEAFVYSGGVLTRHKHGDIGFLAGPTYAAKYFEARIDRHAPTLAGTGIDLAGSARGIVLVTGGNGEVLRYSDPMVFTMPDLAAPQAVEVGLPAQPEGTIRVMSMNVLHGKPIENPEPFARLIKAIKPDVILLQEADDMTNESLESWLSEYVGVLPSKHAWAAGVQGLEGGVGSWDAAAAPDLGVAIATPHLVTREFAEPVVIADPETGRDRTVRAVFAQVSTPRGDVLACSTHLKCCGSAGSREDEIRITEVGAINRRYAEIAAALASESGENEEARLIGGDMNLVGSRAPIDLLARGLGDHGRDLQPAPTPALGTNAWYTWRDDSNEFGPGRLDWILIGDAKVVQSFSLDTRLIDPAVLAECGIEPGDGAVSDHLPVVVDLKPN